MRLLRVSGGLGLALAAMIAGCAQNDRVIEQQAEMELRLEQMAKGNQSISSRLAELETQCRGLEARLREVDAAVGEIKASQEAKVVPPAIVAEKIEAEPLPPESSTRIEVVNSEAEGKGDPKDKEKGASEAYLKAFGVYSKNNYNDAIGAFAEFIRTYPGSEFAGNAQYWIGECLYTQKEYARALEAFKKVVDAYPKGGKVSDAMLKVGFSLISMKEHDRAKAALEELVEKHPKSQAAAKARERLKDPRFNH